MGPSRHFHTPDTVTILTFSIALFALRCILGIVSLYCIVLLCKSGFYVSNSFSCVIIVSENSTPANIDM